MAAQSKVKTFRYEVSAAHDLSAYQAVRVGENAKHVPAKNTQHLIAIAALLLLRSEVSLAGADLEVFLQTGDFDGPVTPVGVEVGGLVRDHVLAA